MDKLTHELYERNFDELIDSQQRVVELTQALLNIFTIVKLSGNIIPDAIAEDIKNKIVEVL